MYFLWMPELEARYPRMASLIGAVVFGAFGWILYDFMFIGYLAPKADGVAGHLATFSRAPMMFLFLYAMLAAFTFSFSVCAKTAVWPSLIFAADDDGVTLGKGVFRNTMRHLPWSEVKSVSPGKIRVRRGQRTCTLPAVEVEFYQDHGMGRSGLNMGHPISRTKFVVAEAVLGKSVSDAIATMERLRERAVGATGS